MAWNIKGLFIQEDQKEETTPTTTVPTTPVATVPSAYIPTTTARTANPSAFEGQLREVVKGHGSEYVKFKQACEDLRAVLPDENIRIKTAFVSMRALGVSKEALTTTAQACLSAVNQEAAEFDTAIRSAYSDQVEGGASRITSIDAQIKEKSAALVAIQTEISNMMAEKGRINTEVEQSRGKIETAKKDFAAAHANLVAEINSDISKINSSL
jgi:predicted  nucleic acid-binding Zn-ribbon protein